MKIRERFCIKLSQSLKVLVCNQGEIDSKDLSGNPCLVPFDLNGIALPPPYSSLGGRISEMRAFPSAAELKTDFVGMVSWRMGAKRGDFMGWSRLTRAGNNLKAGQGIAPYLWRSPQEDLREMAERSFPGMGLLVDRLKDEFPSKVSNPWHVAGNSFIIGSSEMYALERFTREYLAWNVWKSETPAFSFRCASGLRCTSCSRDPGKGECRYARRDVGLFGEVATMYYFQSLSECKFVGIDVTLTGRIHGRLKRALHIVN